MEKSFSKIKAKCIVLLLILFFTSQIFAVPCGDVDSNGIINIVDTLMTARYYVGLIPSFEGSGPTPIPPPCPSQSGLQAETEATWDEATNDSEYSGYTGSGYVNTSNESGSRLQWDVGVSAAGSATCVFRYALGSGARSMDVSVNGSVVGSLSFSSTGAWDNWSSDTIIPPGVGNGLCEPVYDVAGRFIQAAFSFFKFFN